MNLTSILIFFLIAAAGGLTMAYLVLKDKKRPLLVVALHGVFALGGFGALIYYSALNFETGYNKTPYASITFFGIAIVGGFYMLFRDKFLKIGIQKWMPFIHGGAAAIGIILLLLQVI